MCEVPLNLKVGLLHLANDGEHPLVAVEVCPQVRDNLANPALKWRARKWSKVRGVGSFLSDSGENHAMNQILLLGCTTCVVIVVERF